MTARLIVFGKDGKKVVQPLALHHTESATPELRFVLDTSTEHFSEWLFFFLRDLGGYIETTHPEKVCSALNIPCEEKGIVKVAS
jgi:hypothetical protein